MKTNKFQVANSINILNLVNYKTIGNEHILTEDDSVKIWYKNGKSGYRQGTDVGSLIDFYMNFRGCINAIEASDAILRDAGINPEEFFDKEEYIREKNSSNPVQKSKYVNVEMPKEDKVEEKKQEEIIEKKQSKYSEALEALIKMQEIEEKLIDTPDWQQIIKDNKVKNNFGTYRYLVYNRKIDEDIFKYFYNNGYIFRGQLIGKRDYTDAWNASIRDDKSLTYFLYKNPLNGEIEGMTARENNDHAKYVKDSRPYTINYANCKNGFNFLKGKPETIILFEAPIDMLSYLTINKINNKKLNNVLYVATGGSNKKMFIDLVEKMAEHGLTKIIVATDNDEPNPKTGKRAGEEIYKFVKDKFESRFEIVRELPTLKDWNDDLKEIKK